MNTGEMKECPLCKEPIHREAIKCRHCRSFIGAERTEEPWHRGHEDRMLLGVCGAVAQRLSLPAILVRVIFVLLTLFHGFGLLLYGILWALIPGTRDSHAAVRKIGTILTKSTKTFIDTAHEEFPKRKGEVSGTEAAGSGE